MVSFNKKIVELKFFIDIMFSLTVSNLRNSGDSKVSTQLATKVAHSLLKNIN